MFDDVVEGDLETLFLPVQDGHIPSFEQIDIFLEESKRVIATGGKVMVHCHAGVGRTGVFLAIWLMQKYKLDPDEAIRKLRYYRPQSMQFNPDDWFSDPFLVRNADAYQRNLIQERYVHMYYNTVMIPKMTSEEISQSVNSNDTLLALEERCLSAVSVYSEMSGTSGIEPYSESQFVFQPDYSNEEVDDELQRLLKQMSAMTVQEGEGLCYVCRHVLCVGPAPVLPNQSWPPSNARIVYK
jgi:hypothetical protein